MSEIEGQPSEQKAKICQLGVWALLLSLLGLFTFGITSVIGFILAVIADRRICKSKGGLRGRVYTTLAVITSIVILTHLVIPDRPVRRVPCRINLTVLRGAMLEYASDFNGQYPVLDKWCDLLVRHSKVREIFFVCPFAGKGRCHYAINPNCEPNSPEDIVLLFETKGGWNQFGGPEILTLENHNGKGCNVLFNGGRVEFVKPERLGELKWNVDKEQSTEDSGNFRRPGSDEELKYWLENMVWFHRFTNEEIRATMGLTNEEITAALNKFDIRLDNQPKRDEDKPLLVLPYPGGRHPRIGFLEGAIDPQRETKFSVFTPWDKNSYVVVDLPEAIWSNLGLTYLAHTHIDTIWTKQGIELKKLEWNRYPDEMLDIERKLPNGIAFGAKVKPTKKAVRMEMWLKNGTKQKLTDLRVQICVMPKMAAGFEQQTNDNKVFTNPYVACRSTDGERWIITAWQGCHRPWGNARCPCFHSDPKFPDLEPGETKRLRGWLSFYEGTDIEAEFQRIEESGWRKP
jgi:hypothetical protein